MDAKDLFRRSASQGSAIMRCVRPHMLSNPTPCTEWDLRTLINHMVSELHWVPELLMGKTMKQVGQRYEGDLLGSDPGRAWDRAIDAALMAVHHSDPKAIVHLSYGDLPATHYIAEIGGDILIHSWDMGQSVHCTVLFDKELAEAVYKASLPKAKAFAKSGLYGKPVKVSARAPIQTKLLAFFGRRDPTNAGSTED